MTTSRPASGLSLRKAAPVPFPTKQLFILALCRICEPIAFMSIFPYSYYMVKSFNVTTDERQIAMYAGMVTSAFAMAEFLASIFWGRLSDRVGRKPVLLTGLAGTGVSMVIFGFAPTLPVALFARALGGILNGNIGVLSTTVAEVVTEESHQPRAFSIMPFVWCLGSIIGAGIGGTLAEPVKNYPSVFRTGSLFEQYPYLLPNLVCTIFVVFGLIVGLLFLEETHEDKKGRRDPGLNLGRWILACLSAKSPPHQLPYDEMLTFPSEVEKRNGFSSSESTPRISSVHDNADLPKQLHLPRTGHSWRDMFTNQVLLNILALGVLAFHTIAFEQLLPVLFSMPESNTPAELPFKFVGGFALPTKTIGLIISAQGGLQMIAQIFLFPAINQRLGSLATFRLAIFSYPILYFLVPYLSLVPHTLRYPAIFVLLVWKVTAQALSYPSNNIMLVNQAPSKKVLGTLNGIAASSASLARTAGPTITGIVQANGLKIGYSGLSWWTCALVATTGVAVGLFQQEKRLSGSPRYSVIEDFDDEEHFLGEFSLEGNLSDDFEPRGINSVDCETASIASTLLEDEGVLIATL